MVVVSVPVHLELIPPVDRLTEEELCEVMTEAARIVGQMQTPDSTITAILERLEQTLSDLEKNEVRDGLKREIFTALVAGGIPLERIHTVTMVFVNMLMAGIRLDYIESGDSIVLYLRCLSLASLWRLRDMIMSGLLLRIFSEAIKQIIRSQSRVQLVVQREDFNMCRSCFYIDAGKPEFFLLEILNSSIIFVDYTRFVVGSAKKSHEAGSGASHR